MSADRLVSRATVGDAEDIAGLMADAFHPDPVSGWLLPDEITRRSRHRRFFRVFVDYALWQQDMRRGHVQMRYDGEYAGAALWLDAGTINNTGPDPAAIEKALGPDSFSRFLLLDKLMHQHSTVAGRYAYLPFIAVRPRRQNQSIGRLLLETELAQLEKVGTPAFLIASTDRSRKLYTRLGFELWGDSFTLPDDGPPMWPMLWTPDPQRVPQNEGRWSGRPS